MIRSIIVEDEPMAIELLKNHIDRIDFISSIAEFRNPMDAFHYLQKVKVDLIFLDINMPIMNGIELYKNLKNPPSVIFTTAYSKFAVEGFELDAIDYLIKPILFSRFLKSCYRVRNRMEDKNGSYSSKISQLNDIVYVKSGNKKYNFLWKDIQYLEKDENYVKYYNLAGKQILSRQTLSEIESIFPFYISRIHKSYAVSLIQVQEIGTDFVKINGRQLPLGRTYKKSFSTAVEKFNLIIQS